MRARAHALGNETFVPFPTALAEARALLSSSRENLNQAETAESSVRRSTEQNRSRIETATGALQRHRDQIASARQSLRDLEISVKVLEETHGDATARQAALTQARETEQLATGQLTATRNALANLAPETLTADLSHALARCEAAHALHASEQRRAKAIGKLHQLFSSSREAIDRKSSEELPAPTGSVELIDLYWQVGKNHQPENRSR